MSPPHPPVLCIIPYPSHHASTHSPQRDLRMEHQRSDLFAGQGMPNPDDPYSDDPSAYSSRARLLQGTETLSDGSRRLENAQRIALETEDVGADILRNLRGQREQIEHTRDTVCRSTTPSFVDRADTQLTQADSSIDRAAGTLKKMIYKCV